VVPPALFLFSLLPFFFQEEKERETTPREEEV